jgi:hypothetical protein
LETFGGKGEEIMEIIASLHKVKWKILTLQTSNDWESVAIENQTKATLYDELVEQFPKEMGELLEEGKTKSKKWHFKQIGKYISAFDVAYEHIQ